MKKSVHTTKRLVSIVRTCASPKCDRARCRQKASTVGMPRRIEKNTLEFAYIRCTIIFLNSNRNCIVASRMKFCF